MGDILVVDVMTRDPVTAKPGDNLFDCAKKMVRKRVGSLVLVEKKKLVGFIDQMDILWAMIKKSQTDLKKIKAIDISPKKIVTIRPNATIPETITKMKKTKFERFPVVDKGELVGFITIKDILGFSPEFYPELEEFRKIREEAEKLKRIKKARESSTGREGICEECGESDFLYRFNGMLICESCKDSV